MTIREEIYNLRSVYNKKVFELRSEKVALVEYVNNKKKKLDEIHKVIPAENRKYSPINVKIDDDLEYPEKVFELNTYLNPLQEDGSKLCSFDQMIGDENTMFHLQSEIMQGSSDPMAMTSWEQELKKFNLHLQLHEQDRILTQIELQVNQFDKKLNALFEERLDSEAQAKFLEQFILTLNCELWVLKDYEQLEGKLVDKTEQQIFERNRFHMELIQERSNIDTYKGKIVEIEEAQNEIESKFIERCKPNEYWPYFKRIFYKKYRAPRIPKTRDENEDAVYGKCLLSKIFIDPF